MEMKEIAKGFYLNSDGQVIHAAVVDKELADRLLSEAAKSRGEDDGRYLNYPYKDGRSSIPTYELGQRGYIHLKPKELFSEFQRMVKMVPDYLRERGLFPPKKVETLSDKVEKDFNSYIKEISKMKKTDIIGRAEEIAEIKKIKEYMQKPHTDMKNFGVMLNSDNILKDFHERMKNDKVTKGIINNKTISRQIGLYSLSEKTSADEKYMNTFANELETTKKQTVQTVTFTVGLPGKELQEISMPVKEFYRHIDKGVLERFSAASMPDFPATDYYGDKYKQLYEELREKRFCEDIAKNFNDYNYPEKKEGYYIYISDVSKKPYAEQSELQEIKNRLALKEYASARYEKPQETVKLIDSYVDSRKSIVDDIAKVIASATVVSGTVEAVSQSAEKITENVRKDLQPNVNVPVQEKQPDIAKEVISSVIKANEQAKAKSEPTAVNIADNIMNQINLVRR